jgi:two-component system sensor histidine kinase YesM
MPEEEVNLILRDDTTRVHKRGSGIGLSNVHQRIQLYFGPQYGLLIDSELDEGTTVHIHLPRVVYSTNTLNEEGETLDEK